MKYKIPCLNILYIQIKIYLLSILHISLQIQYNLNLKIREERNHYRHISSVHKTYRQICHSRVQLFTKTHIDNILPKLSSACYAMRSVKPYMSQQMLLAIYYSCFHSIMSYGIISANSIRVFRLQTRIIRIIFLCKSRDSCRKFISLKILPLPS